MLMLSRFRKLPWRPLVRHCSAELQHKESFIEKLRSSYQDDEQSNLIVPIFKKAMLFPDALAIKDLNGEFTYFQLYLTAKKLSFQISNICGSSAQLPVVFLCFSNALWVILQWACWMSGQIAVPLEPSLSQEQLRRQAADCKAKLIIATPECEAAGKDLAQEQESAIVIVDHSFVPTLESVCKTSVYTKELIGHQGSLIAESTLPNDFYAKANAMILYTPGSLNSQKAVLLSHRTIDAQMRCLVNGWQLTASDCMLPVLSMGRMHAALGALLSLGGNVALQQNFDCTNVWSALLGINSPSRQRVNIFLAMPTIYKRLIAEYDKMFAEDSRMVKYIKNHCTSKIRLMAAAFSLLPDAVFQRWHLITGVNIYEHYGALETGIVLGQPIGEQTPDQSTSNSASEAVAGSGVSCHPGTLGRPLVGVTARLVDKKGNELVTWKHGESPTLSSLLEKDEMKIATVAIGELQIAGDCVFSGYLGDASSEDNVNDGFYKSQDICTFHLDNFQFLSKSSDILTVGGYKIFGSEIKKILITHPSIKDVAVLGIPNKIWGQSLGVICIVASEAEVDLEGIKSFCYQHLPFHKHPTVFKTIVAK